jgi:hypothetical protein
VIYATLMAIFLAEPIRVIYSNLFDVHAVNGPMVLLIQTLFASVIILLFGEILSKADFQGSGRLSYQIYCGTAPHYQLHFLAADCHKQQCLRNDCKMFEGWKRTQLKKFSAARMWR